MAGSLNVPDAEHMPRWGRSLGVGSLCLLVALIAARSTSSWIATRFPDRPTPPDLMFEILPHSPKAGYIADLALVAALALLIVYAFRGNQREIPVMMALIGIMEFSRALLNVLTPLGRPLKPGEYYGIGTELEHVFMNVFGPFEGSLPGNALHGITVSQGMMHVTQHGEFPSGHMAFVFLCMLLVDKKKAPRIRAAMVVLVVAECVALLVSHQHYAIDVVGGFLLSYFIYYEYTEGTWFDWLKPLITV